MNFSDEHYVRIYTRDTKTWLRWGWEGQCVFMFVMRKVDKSGVIDDIDDPVVDVSLITGLPEEVVAVGLPKVVKSGAIEITDGHLVVPKYIDAQTATKSDRQRARERRERRRDSVTKRDPGVTKRDATDRDQEHVQPKRVTKPRDESDRKPTIPVGSVTKRDEGDRDGPDSVENGHHYNAVQRSNNAVATATPPAVVAVSSGGGVDVKVRCPPDLRLLDDQRGTLETALVPGWAIDALTAHFVAKSLGDPNDRRTLVAWRKCLSQAIAGNWNNPRTRPKAPEPAAGEDDTTGGYGAVEDWA